MTDRLTLTRALETSGMQSAAAERIATRSMTPSTTTAPPSRIGASWSSG
jgi:hypothetical protein